MSAIEISRPSRDELESMNVLSWPIWEKEVSKFDWYYDDRETCYILEGTARVEPEEGDPAEFGPGDMVVFPKGMKCVWEIISDIRKHYKFG